MISHTVPNAANIHCSHQGVQTYCSMIRRRVHAKRGQVISHTIPNDLALVKLDLLGRRHLPRLALLRARSFASNGARVMILMVSKYVDPLSLVNSASTIFFLLKLIMQHRPSVKIQFVSNFS